MKQLPLMMQSIYWKIIKFPLQNQTEEKAFRFKSNENKKYDFKPQYFSFNSETFFPVQIKSSSQIRWYLLLKLVQTSPALSVFWLVGRGPACTWLAGWTIQSMIWSDKWNSLALLPLSVLLYFIAVSKTILFELEV